MFILDGYPLLGDSKEDKILTQYINKYIPLDSFCPFLAPDTPTAGLAMLTEMIGQHPYKTPRVGRFIWPTGASRFGYGHFLADSDTTQLIMEDAYNNDGSYNPIILQLGNPESNQQGTIIPAETVKAQVFLLPPTPLSGIRGLSVTGEFAPQSYTASLYLLTVVDQRYTWWYQNVGDLTGQITSSTTWSSLINQLLAIVNVYQPNFTVNLDMVNVAYLGPSSQMFTLPYEPIPPVLDALAFNIGMRWVFSFDGSQVSAQLYQTALNAINTDMNTQLGMNRIIVSGGQRFSNPM